MTKNKIELIQDKIWPQYNFEVDMYAPIIVNDWNVDSLWSADIELLLVTYFRILRFDAIKSI